VQCNGTIVTGETASAIGINNTASGKASFTGGIDSEAIEKYSLAFGDSAKAWSRNSIALGKQVSVFGAYSFGVGENVKTNSTSTMVIGSGFDDYNPLVNDINKSLMIGFYSNKPTLFIGSATGNNLTGKIGIGDVTVPQAKLHIKADDGETAELYVQWSNNNMANLWLGTTSYGLKASTNKLEFKTPTGGKYIFNDGNVGIGTLNPTEKLEVAGSIKASGGFMLAYKLQAIDLKGLSLFGTSGTGILIANDGKVGIGTMNPSEKLEVTGNIKQNTGYRTLTPEVRAVDANGLRLSGNSSGQGIVINSSGNVGIGTTPTLNRLEVAGTVNATAFIGNGSGLNNVPGDNLGNHIAMQNIQMNGKWLSNDGGNEGIFINDAGNIGIMTSNLNAQFEIADIYEPGGMNLKIGNDCYFTDIDISNSLGLYGCNQSNTSASLKLGSGGIMITGKDGKLGVGNQNPMAMLDVNGDIKATSMTLNNLIVTTKIEAGEIEVKDLSEWKDCVFEYDYKLISLKETEEYIKQNKHLPGIPSEKEVLENGINVGEMNAMLLQKIEELTLHIIDLDHKIFELSKK